MKTVRILLPILLLALAGCASLAPAPVADSGAPVRIEAGGRPAAGGADYYTVKKGDTLYSIALDHGVEYRELVAWNNIDNPNRIRVGQQLRVVAPGAATATPAMPAPASGAEVKPVRESAPVTARPLDGSAAPGAAAPTVAENTDTLKRTPKGGVLPYSEENLARLKDAERAPVQVATAPPVQTVTPAAPVAAAPAPASAAATAGEIAWAWPAPGKVIGTFSEGGDGAEASKGIDIAGKPGEPVLAAAAGKIVYVGNGLRGYGNLVIVRHSPVYLSAYAHNSRILVKEGDQVTRGQKIAELGNSDADQPKLHFEVRYQGKPVDPLKYLPPR